MDYDYPTVEFHSERRVTVKRGRKCTICGHVIPPGYVAVLTVSKIDGEFGSDVACDTLASSHAMCPVREKVCPDCKGAGIVLESDGCPNPAECPKCRGRQVVKKTAAEMQAP